MKENGKKTMKRILRISGIIVVVLVAAAIVSFFYLRGAKIEKGPSEITRGSDENTKTLVVYFTRKGIIPDESEVDATASASLNLENGTLMGNTEIPARMIQEITGGDLYQIYPERYYHNTFWGTAAKAYVEEALNLRPKLAEKPYTLDQYDIIYICYPIWWFNPPMAVGTFLESYDLSGKTVIPISTSTDNSVDISMDYIRECCRGATVLDGFTANGADMEKIREWIGGD